MAETSPASPPRPRRSALVTAGALLCCLGLANWVVGGVRLAKYAGIAERTLAPPRDPAALSTGFTFSDVSESQERHNIALAKLQYYSVVLAAGQVLLAAGLLLIFGGYLRSPRPSAPAATQNVT